MSKTHWIYDRSTWIYGGIAILILITLAKKYQDVDWLREIFTGATSAALIGAILIAYEYIMENIREDRQHKRDRELAKQISSDAVKLENCQSFYNFAIDEYESDGGLYYGMCLAMLSGLGKENEFGVQSQIKFNQAARKLERYQKRSDSPEVAELCSKLSTNHAKFHALYEASIKKAKSKNLSDSEKATTTATLREQNSEWLSLIDKLIDQLQLEYSNI